MGWQVTSTISGGQPYAVADREEYASLARLLDDVAADWRAASAAWSAAALELAQHQASLTWCSSATPDEGTTVSHSSLPYGALIQRCSDLSVDCATIGEELDTLSALLVRAHSLYEDNEAWVRRLVTMTVTAAAIVAPQYTALGTYAVAKAGILTGSAAEGKDNRIYGLTSTQWAQEGLVRGASVWVNGLRRASLPLLNTDQGYGVDDAAGFLAAVTKPIQDAKQGDVLTVSEVMAEAVVVKESHSVAESLENLRRLAEERLGTIDLGSKLIYGTVAVQRYRHADGSSAWLITIPGTDGEHDSPFDWLQNLEIMSDDPVQRMTGDSARMVAEAMRQAGIGADEPVALIGHSQGGIVAATIAADLADQYNIQHVMTAGSPVANHPIPSTTWVTSIEMDDELVAALDGAPNPSTDNWLTIRGHATRTDVTSQGEVSSDGSCLPGNGFSSWSRGFAAEEVKGASEDKEITHWLKYHQAAYKNASDLGSHAVNAHEEHFRRIIDGTLEETRYYQGTMSHTPLPSTVMAPDSDRIDMQRFDE
ncbi:alpha/beta fold hydrolase [Bifidobacterium biavatii]|nr:alpha/beta fold hydrolase [Bifidobacterium biavatii]